MNIYWLSSLFSPVYIGANRRYVDLVPCSSNVPDELKEKNDLTRHIPSSPLQPGRPIHGLFFSLYFLSTYRHESVLGCLPTSLNLWAPWEQGPCLASLPIIPTHSSEPGVELPTGDCLLKGKRGLLGCACWLVRHTCRDGAEGQLEKQQGLKTVRRVLGCLDALAFYRQRGKRPCTWPWTRNSQGSDAEEIPESVGEREPSLAGMRNQTGQ